MFRRHFLLCFDVAGDPAGGGPGGGTPAGGAPSGGSPSPATPASSAPAGASGGAPTAGAPGGNRPGEPDRSTWIPPYRLDEERRKAEERYRALAGQHQSLEKRVRTLMGIAEPADPKIAEVRKAFGELMPELRPLLDKPKVLEKLLQFVESGQIDELGSGAQAGWNRHAQAMVSSALTKYASAAGVPAAQLPKDALSRLAQNLQGFIARDPSGQRNARYEHGDQTLLDEFVSDLVGFYVSPHRAAAAANVTGDVRRARALPAADRRAAAPAGAEPPANAGRFTSKKARFEAMRQALLAGQPNG